MRDLEKMAKECRECADAYNRAPGMAGPGANAGTIADLYGAIARLAEIVDRGKVVDSPHPALGTEKYQTFKETR